MAYSEQLLWYSLPLNKRKRQIENKTSAFYYSIMYDILVEGAHADCSSTGKYSTRDVFISGIMQNSIEEKLLYIDRHM